MNKKAEEVTKMNTVFLILLAFFVVGMLLMLYEKKDGASLIEEYYAKKISNIVNIAEPNDEISVNVHQATKIAKSNDVSFSEIFYFNNSKSEMCVKLSKGRATCYAYYNNVDIISPEIKLGLGDEGTNVLTFKISEKLK